MSAAGLIAGLDGGSFLLPLSFYQNSTVLSPNWETRLFSIQILVWSLEPVVASMGLALVLVSISL